MNTLNYADGLLEYQKFTLDDFNLLEPISGRRILEVGGYHNSAVAHSLYNLSGQRVVVINPDERITQSSDDKLEVMRVDGCHTPFADESFDAIVGVAVLEHINNLNIFMQEMRRILAPKGKLYLQGRPLWTCNVGHHIYLINEEMDYRFNGNNPIDDFDHLFLTEKEMCEKLVEQKRLPLGHARKVADYVYNSPELNRLSLDAIISAFEAIGFSETKIKYNYAQDEVPAVLSEKNKINGVCLFARK